MKNFLLNPFLNSVFPFDIQPASFSTYGENNYVLRRPANVTSIINYIKVDAVQQTSPDSYVTADSLATLYSAYRATVPAVTPPIGAIIFISDTSNPENYEGAEGFATSLKNVGVTLTFVLLGPNVNQNLVNFADNYLTWTDLNQPQPDNWNTASLTAYACVGISTVPPTTTVATNTTMKPTT
uniref:VWFA domain-containing protein n=1 Tax=Panagrolaimus sp. JU765 TaxID=591449 RepID=A0AC34RGA5_9BILA